MLGLVLEGGALRGLYTEGILDVFLEEGINADVVIGVSAGVTFGINYPSKQIGRALRYNKKYMNDKRYMGVGSYLKTGNFVNKEFAYYKLPKELDIFNEEEYNKRKMKFYATCTNCLTGEPEYIEITDCFAQMEVIRASSTLPYVHKMVEVDGVPYLDGGLSDSIPLKKMQEMGVDKIVVIETRPEGYRKEESSLLFAKLMYKRKYENLYKALANRTKMYNEELDFVESEEKKGNCFVFRPSKDLGVKRFEKDIQKLEDMYNLGKENAKENLYKLKEYLNGELSI